MFLDRIHQIRGPAIVQEEQPLPDSPEWICTELVPAGRFSPAIDDSSGVNSQDDTGCLFLRRALIDGHSGLTTIN
jgi:hypothetical protein